MLRAILAQDPKIKLFAVGDDWQSIYRFAGADVAIMRNFEQEFGTTETRKLTMTFRSYQEIVDVSSRFVSKNPQQINKTVVSFHGRQTTQAKRKQVQLIWYTNKEQHISLIHQNLAKLEKLAIKQERSWSGMALT